LPSFSNLGKANSGKTTIIEKVCGVGAGTKPVIRDQNGQKMHFASLMKGTVMRGKHDIEHQITYKGSQFIFHDSCGFEAGGTEEVTSAKLFIEKRVKNVNIKESLHAIWYCIPLDDDRIMSDVEASLVQQYVKTVPIIIVFTKYDAYPAKIFGPQSSPHSEKLKREAQRSFNKHCITEAVKKASGYICLSDMQAANSNCSELIEKTAETLGDGTVYKLFLTTQKNSYKLCRKFCLWKYINNECITEHNKVLSYENCQQLFDVFDVINAKVIMMI